MIQAWPQVFHCQYFKQKNIMFQYKIFQKILSGMAAIALLSGMACSGHAHDDHGHEENAADAHAPETEGALSLTAEQMKAVGITLGKMEHKNLHAVVLASGSLEVPPQNKAELTTLTGGIITHINVLEGGVVKKGQVLATLENTDFLKIQQEYVTLKNAFSYTEAEFQRQKDLNAGQAGAGKAFQQAEANYKAEKAKIAALERQLEQLGISPAGAMAGNFATHISLRAPISGTVSHITAKIGTFAEPTRPLLQIVDNSQIHCDLLVYEKDLHKVKVGQKVHFTLTNQDSRQITGEIYGVNSSFENEAKAVLVHAKIAGGQSKGLIPGMYVNGVIDVGSQFVPALPVDAVVQEGGRSFVFVAGNEGNPAEEAGETHFRKAEVATGVSELGYVEITPIDSLSEGAQIVVQGAFYLLSKAAGPAEHDH